MRKKNILRSGAALATALACLALMANPASATVHDAAIRSGEIAFFNTSGTPDFMPTLPLAGTGGTGCGPTLQVTANASTTGTVDVTTYTSIGRFTLGTTAYVADITRQSSTAGTYNDTTGQASSVQLTVRMDIYAATNQGTATDCAHGTTRACRFSNIALTLSGFYGGSLATPAVGLTAVLTGSGTLGASSPPCNAPFTGVTNGTASISCFAFTLTT